MIKFFFGRQVEKYNTTFKQINPRKFQKGEVNPNVNSTKVRIMLNAKRDQYLKYNIVNSKLSESLAKKQKMKQIFKFNKEKLEKHVQKFYQEQIKFNESKEMSQDTLELGYHELKRFKLEENKLLQEEVKVFQKLYFKKKETKRLIYKQQINNHQQLVQIQKGEENEIIKENIQYKENMDQLKNQRIQDMLNTGGENLALSILVESGILQNKENIEKIIQLGNQINKNYSQSDTLSNELVLVEENQNLISQLNLRLDESQNFLDFNKLEEFFKTFKQQDQQCQIQTLQKLQYMTEIKQYENNLFDKFYNNSLQMQLKKQLDFHYFTTKQLLNYIKFNIYTAQDVLNFVKKYADKEMLKKKNLQGYDIFKPEVCCQIVAKLQQFALNKDRLLDLIADNFYKKTFRIVVQKFNQMEDIDIVDSIYSFSEIHRFELGLIYPRMFKKFIEISKIEILKRLDGLTPAMTCFLSRSMLNLSELKEDPDIQQNMLVKLQQIQVDEIYSLQGIMLYLIDIQEIPLLRLVVKQFLKKGSEIDSFYQRSINSAITFLTLKSDFQLTLTEKQELKNIYMRNYRFIDVSTLLSTVLLNQRLQLDISDDSIRKQKKQTIQIINQHNFQKYNDNIYQIYSPNQLVVLTKALSIQDLNDKIKYDLLNIQHFHYVLFKQSSPQYEFYAQVFLEIEKEFQLINIKNMSLYLDTMSQIRYFNEIIVDKVRFVLLERAERQKQNKKNIQIFPLIQIIKSVSYFNVFDQEQLQKTWELIQDSFLNSKYDLITLNNVLDLANAFIKLNLNIILDLDFEVTQKLFQFLFDEKVVFMFNQLNEDQQINILWLKEVLQLNCDLGDKIFNNTNYFQHYLLLQAQEISQKYKIQPEKDKIIQLNEDQKQCIEKNYNYRFTIEQFKDQICNILQDFKYIKNYLFKGFLKIDFFVTKGDQKIAIMLNFEQDFVFETKLKKGILSIDQEILENNQFQVINIEYQLLDELSRENKIEQYILKILG